MNISDGKHIDLEDIDTIIHEEESKHNPNNDQIDTGDGDDDDDTILDNSGNIKVEDTLYQFKVTVNTKELGLTFQNGNLKKSIIKENCFGTSYISDLVDQQGFKRIGSAQYRKRGGFLQHGEIQINPSREIWFKLFGEEAPPKLNFNFTNDEIIQHLKSPFLDKKLNLKYEHIDFNTNCIKKIF